MEDLTLESDGQLVTRIARYDELALAEIYRRHGGAVYGLARRVLQNDAEAEDVTQEVFVKLWSQPEKFDATRGTLRGYLLAKSHSRAVDVIRSHEARRARERRDALASAATPNYGAATEAWDVLVGEEVQRALASLPENERRAIELAYFEGLSYTKVAERLDQPEGTVKSRIRNGMRRMRDALEVAGVTGVEI